MTNCRYCTDDQMAELCDNCVYQFHDEYKDLLLRSHRVLHEILGYYVSDRSGEYVTITELMEEIRDLIGESVVREFETKGTK